MSAEIGTGHPAGPDLQVEDPVRMDPIVTAAEALAVFQRKLPGAVAEARVVHHPFWWAALEVRTRGLFRRSPTGSGQRLDVLVNAVSGRGMIADFTPHGVSVVAEEWWSLIGEQSGPLPSRGEAERSARSLARAKVVKTVKLGMGIEITPVDDLRGVLKPNWIVTGGNEKHSATILVDGLDGSHYIVRADRAGRS
ncbi:hypothetical protein SAMN04489752_2880 [Brevibacterium siliguriense]|uniref:Uncharacterized protein n=1 Tax=Brevibacterium siliguriense TaxID=1136497 RepID=A0A1H1W6B5_9MICO|nr:hypothetical protein [Brevibacterium siliguriense]SDS92858.1 hypothetical protein SAMN04489752_2880 [Brevibacterium siliguriense]